MDASCPERNVEAAMSVAHSLTTHSADIEVDWFTACDDLAEQGSGHIGTNEFSSGVFYRYASIDIDLLANNIKKTVHQFRCIVSVKGFHFYLYLILDVFSRKIVGWEIHDEESAAHAAKLIRRTHLREDIRDKPLILHSDNGSPMKGASMLETLYQLGVATSFSRPRVSNDNAYSESIFKTCKYRPDYPYKGFLNIDQARDWVLKFSHWYNVNHKHSGLKFVTPHQRHAGLAKEVLAKRKEVYQQARVNNPERWSGQTRNWELSDKVHLNPARDRVEIEDVK